MATYYHGTTGELKLHAGICLTRDDRAASHYGSDVHAIEIGTDSLQVERLYFDDVEARQRYDDNEYPCDTAAEIAAYVARGVDVIVYDDYDMHGNQHTTTRLLSDAALAAVRVLEAN